MWHRRTSLLQSAISCWFSGRTFRQPFIFYYHIYYSPRSKCQKNLEYVSHLSLDFVIALLATFWMLYVFSFAGWLIHLFESVRQDLSGRNEDYRRMLNDALRTPFANKRNIYFGLILGVSAMLPYIYISNVFLSNNISTRNLIDKLYRLYSQIIIGIGVQLLVLRLLP